MSAAVGIATREINALLVAESRHVAPDARRVLSAERCALQVKLDRYQHAEAMRARSAKTRAYEDQERQRLASEIAKIGVTAESLVAAAREGERVRAMWAGA